jgi:hypothetical protein
MLDVPEMVTRAEPKRDRAAYMRAYRAKAHGTVPPSPARVVTPMVTALVTPPLVTTPAPLVTPQVVTHKLPWTKPVVREITGIEAVIRRSAFGLQTTPSAACLRDAAAALSKTT